jgi:hypothetical protein
MRKVAVWLNPLDPFGPVDRAPSLEDMLEFMCTPGVPSDSASMQDRYRAITSEQPGLFSPPANDRILNQLVWPLRHAKACYVVGNYLGTIALAGLVAEMTAILIFELTESKLNEKPMTRKEEERLFGRAFEELDQMRRIEVLKAYGSLTQEVADAFGRIRGTRRRHLHLAQLVEADALARDARVIFRDAVSVVAAAIGQKFEDGKLVLTPQLMRYLERAGQVRLSDNPSADPT